jgi:hypothetical protein
MPSYVHESLSVTFSVDLDDDRWRQASLPVMWGGLYRCPWCCSAGTVRLFGFRHKNHAQSSHPPSVQHDSTTSGTAASIPPCLPGFGMHHMFDYTSTTPSPRRHRFQQPNEPETTHAAKCKRTYCSKLSLNLSIELACSPHVLQVPVFGSRPYHCPVSV